MVGSSHVLSLDEMQEFPINKDIHIKLMRCLKGAVGGSL